MTDIQRYIGHEPNRTERRALERANGAALSMQLAAQLEQARQHAMASTTEFAMLRFVQLKRLQNDLEKFCPDATEGLAMFANNTLLNMAGSLQQFGQEIR